MALLKRKRSGLTDPMSVVTRFVNACNRHDADGVSACLHPDFDSIQPMHPARNFRGADQVRRNWQAIFEAEPGFRLTVLRQAAADDTVWLELHGAGRDAEVAGVFVMGIQGDRVRWARIYSALVEPLPPGAEDSEPSSPATLRRVPPLGEPGDGVPAAAGTAPAAAAGDDPMAQVVDIEGGGRSRRRRSRRRSYGEADLEEAAGDGPEATGEVLPDAEAEVAPVDAEAEVAPVDAEAVDLGAEPAEPAEPAPPQVVEEPVVAEADVVEEPAFDEHAVADQPGPGTDAGAVVEVVVEPAAPVAEPAEAAAAPAPEPIDLVWAEPAGEQPQKPEKVVSGQAAAADHDDDIVWADPDPDGDATHALETRSADDAFGRPGKRRGRRRR